MAFGHPDADLIKDKKRPRRRIKKMAITFELLDVLFDWPEGASITSIFADHDRRLLYLNVEGDCFDEVYEGQEAPEFEARLKQLVEGFLKIEYD